MTCRPGRPRVENQVAEAEAIPPERYPELIRTLRERDPAAYIALLAEAMAEAD